MGGLQGVLEVVLREGEGVGAGHGRQQLALVRRVVEQADLRTRGGVAELTPVLPVPDGDVQTDLGGADRGPADADPTADERAEHREEATAGRGDGAGVRAVGRDLGVAVQQRLPRHPDVVEADPTVVDAAQAGLGAGVGDGHPRAGAALLVADRHQQGVQAVFLAVGDQLREHDRETAVAGRVADVVLACGLVRGVHHELLRGRVVGSGRAQPLHVGAVTGLGHREAAGQAEVHDRRQVAVVVGLGAERLDRAAEQAPLDPGLDGQRQVTHAEHLERRDGGPDVVLPAVGRREAQQLVGRAGDLGHRGGDPGAVGLVVVVQAGGEPGGVVDRPDLLAERVVRPVEGATQGVGVGAVGGSCAAAGRGPAHEVLLGYACVGY